MEDIKALLQRYSPQEPPEILAIKQYIHDTFDLPSSVGVQGETIVITVPSAAFANALRFHTTRLQEAANTSKRILFRIG